VSKLSIDNYYRRNYNLLRFINSTEHILIMHIHVNHPLNLFYILIFIISVIIRDSLKMETRISENLQ
jgi:hypothetical protein